MSGPAVQGWVGYIETRGVSRTVKLDGEVVVGATVEVGLPNERVFRLQTILSGESAAALRGEVVARGEAIRFGGCSDGEVFIETCETAAGPGRLELRRVHVWELDAYRRLSEQYVLDGGRRISVHVNADEWVGVPALFYAEADRFVRSTPTSAATLSRRMASTSRSAATAAAWSRCGPGMAQSPRSR